MSYKLLWPVLGLIGYRLKCFLTDTLIDLWVDLYLTDKVKWWNISSRGWSGWTLPLILDMQKKLNVLTLIIPGSRY